jgi:hypothetical protein
MKKKEDKPRKDKKPGMLSKLFKRKDRESRTTDDEIDDLEKLSDESPRKESSDSSSQDTRSSKSQQVPSPQRQPGKLQKSPPPELSPVQTSSFQSLDAQSPPNTTQASPTITESTSSTLRQVNAGSQESVGQSEDSSEQSNPAVSSDRRPVQRYLVDPVDPFDDEQANEASPTEGTRSRNSERLSDSPIHVELSPTDTHPLQDPPGLIVDTSSQEEPSRSPISPTSSTEIIEGHESKSDDAPTPASTITSSAPTPTWSDDHLLAYVEDQQNREIEELMLRVRSSVGVPYVASDHPAVIRMYENQENRLQQLQRQLESMHRAFVTSRGYRY